VPPTDPELLVILGLMADLRDAPRGEKAALGSMLEARIRAKLGGHATISVQEMREHIAATYFPEYWKAHRSRGRPDLRK
jgi:hypothetical protein